MSERTKIKNKKWLDKYKLNNECVVCGESRPWVLEFHHVNPKTKIASLSSMCNSYGIKKIKEEVRKCILVCANCHRDIHYKKKY